MNKLISDIKNNAFTHGSLPFWSWNDKLSPEILREQIRDMKRLGMGGFFMHARSGLETEYLSDEWYDCVNACTDEAKKLNMEAWAYDENGWPSGFAGGALLRDSANHARYLECVKSDKFEPDAIGVYILNLNKMERITSPVYKPDEYICIFVRSDESYVDTMNADITKEFIKYTHEDYKKHCKDEFGKTMPGFFTDEPQYYRWRTVWSDLLPEEFEKRYGYSVLDAIPALFYDYDGAEEYRYDYWKLCHELFIQNWIKVIYEWSEKNNCRITGHAIEERSLNGQMMCCGGVMPFYEYQHIPGVDFLGRRIDNDMSAKQVGSVAAQLGKKKVLSEMFACCGWDVTPVELKQIAEYQYYGGVNLMCQHLYPYSERGQRKRDYPAHYSEHLPWQNAMSDFNAYFNNLGYTLSLGKEFADTLLIHPIHSAYLQYKRILNNNQMHELEEGFASAIRLLSENHVSYHLGDEDIMKNHASVENGELKIGLCSYKYVILPTIYTLDSSTCELLREFIKQGGKLCLLDNIPTRIDGKTADTSFIIPNINIREITDNAAVTIKDDSGETLPGFRVMIRDTDYGRIFYVLNLNLEKRNSVKISVNGVDSLSILDMSTLKNIGISNISKTNGVETTLDFEPAGSYILLDIPCEYVPAQKPIEAVLSDIKLANLPVNSYTLDYACVSFDGINYSEKRPIVRIKDELLRDKYKGDLYLKFCFSVENVPQSVNLAAEPLNYKSIIVNGTEIALNRDNKWFDRSFLTSVITSLVKNGNNEIIFKIDYYQDDYVYYVLYGGVSESLRNCLNFNVEIESVYLFGNFSVNCDKNAFSPAHHNSLEYTGDFSVSTQSTNLDFSNIVFNGYPFFSGHIDIHAKAESGNRIILPGHYSCAEILIDNHVVKRLLFENYIDFDKDFDGEEIIIKLYNSNRNLLGPHHFEDSEPIAVGPEIFSFEKQWIDEKCAAYKDRYAFVEFGTNL